MPNRGSLKNGDMAHTCVDRTGLKLLIFLAHTHGAQST